MLSSNMDASGCHSSRESVPLGPEGGCAVGEYKTVVGRVTRRMVIVRRGRVVPVLNHTVNDRCRYFLSAFTVCIHTNIHVGQFAARRCLPCD